MVFLSLIVGKGSNAQKTEVGIYINIHRDIRFFSENVKNIFLMTDSDSKLNFKGGL